MFASICGVSRATAKNWLKREPLSRRQALRLSEYLEGHAARAMGLAREMRDYAVSPNPLIRPDSQAVRKLRQQSQRDHATTHRR